MKVVQIDVRLIHDDSEVIFQAKTIAKHAARVLLFVPGTNG